MNEQPQQPQNKIVTGYGVPKKYGQKGTYSQSDKSGIPPKPTNVPEQTRMWLDGLNTDTKPNSDGRK